MNHELTFFTIDERAEKAIKKLQEIQIQRIVLDKQKLFKKVRILLTELKSVAGGISPLYEEGFDKCVNIFEETSRSSDLEVLVCLVKLSLSLNSLCRERKEDLMKICQRIESLIQENWSIYEYFKLSPVLKEWFGEEYVSIIELARIYSMLELQSIEEFEEKIKEEDGVSSLLKGLRHLVGIGEVNLVKAYSHLVKLIERLHIRELIPVPLNWFENLDYFQILRNEMIDEGVEPALAYVLAHVAERIDLDELAKELEVYVKLELADPRISPISMKKEKVKKPRRSPIIINEEKVMKVYSLYLNLVKIVSLPLCLASKEVDWRLAIALGLSAARYWGGWNDVSSFTGLCSGLMALSQYVPKEEAERVLVYTTLFRDFDFIIKLEPLLRVHRSLRSLASYL